METRLFLVGLVIALLILVSAARRPKPAQNELSIDYAVAAFHSARGTQAGDL